MTEWREVKLGDVCLSVSYGYTASATQIFSGAKFLRITDIVPYFIDWDAVPYCKISEKDFKKYKLNIGDIVIARTGATTGYNAVIEHDFNAVYASYLIRFKPNKEIFLPKFAKYILKTTYYKKFIENNISGSAQPGINAQTLSLFSFLLPPLDVQRKIAGVLGALDDKIELNNKINQNLEAQAQALFKSWFIDFEPFGGKMPNDWKIGKLGDIADITSGKRPLFKSNIKTSNALIPIVGASGVMGYTKEYLYNNKILVTGRVGTHGIIQRFNKTCWPSDNTLIISSNFYEYVYNYLKIIDFSSMNRGSTQPLITQSDLKKCDIIIPSRLFLDKFEKNVSILFDLKDKNTQEIENLAELRDTLLPKLMNGEIDVDNVKID